MSSWSPSGSLAWDEPTPAEIEESAADAGTETPATTDVPAAAPAPEDLAARLMDAERLFSDGELAGAAEIYAAAVDTGPPGLQARVLHRLAWCEHGLGRTLAGTERLRRLLDLLAAPADDAERSLRAEAVRDLGLLTAALPDTPPERAIGFLEAAVRAGELRPALGALADQYRATGRLEAERAVRERLRGAD